MLALEAYRLPHDTAVPALVDGLREEYQGSWTRTMDAPMLIPAGAHHGWDGLLLAYYSPEHVGRCSGWWE